MKEYTMKRKHAYQVLYAEDNVAELGRVLQEASSYISGCYHMQYEGEKTLSFMVTPMDGNGVEHSGIGFVYHLRTGKIKLKRYNGWTRYKVDRLFPMLVEDLEEDLYRVFDEDITIAL
jgi:hypothetical protein